MGLFIGGDGSLEAWAGTAVASGASLPQGAAGGLLVSRGDVGGRRCDDGASGADRDAGERPLRDRHVTGVDDRRRERRGARRRGAGQCRAARHGGLRRALDRRADRRCRRRPLQRQARPAADPRRSARARPHRHADRTSARTGIMRRLELPRGDGRRGIRETRRITDVSANRLHGRTVNVPTRAVTGHNWEAREQNFIHAPEEYGAIHFHDDDLGDARWDVDFTLTVPRTSRRLYAARLRADDDTDYVPFYVRARAVRRSASASSRPRPATWPTPTTMSRKWSRWRSSCRPRASDVGGQQTLTRDGSSGYRRTTCTPTAPGCTRHAYGRS